MELAKRSVSKRIQFQWNYVDEYYTLHCKSPDGESPPILNIGCADDPCKFGDLVHHVDIDDWSYLHKWFTQTDASKLPFPDESYKLVILGDILEHCEKPMQVVSEACRVCGRGGKMIFTIFEEWRLPGPGQWIKEAQELADKINRDMGYKDREDFQAKNFPERKGVDDNKISHLTHINRFTEVDIMAMCNFVQSKGFEIEDTQYICDTVHEGHPCMNWLLAFRRSST